MKDLQGKKQPDDCPMSLELFWNRGTGNVGLPFEEELTLVFRAACHWQGCYQLWRSRAEFRFRADELESPLDTVARIRARDLP